jgi:outer membrane protein OmpA-like peptidoglycan-associated protein
LIFEEYLPILHKSILMKRLLFLPLTILVPGLLIAQLRIAVAGGVHQSAIDEDRDLSNYSKRTGVHLGFIADLQVRQGSGFYFQPGILYYNKGRKYLEQFDTSVSNIVEISRKEFLNTVDMPINLVYKFKLGEKIKFTLGAGPYFSFFFNGKLEKRTISKDTIDFEDKLLYNTETIEDIPVGDGPGKYRSLDLGVNALAGIESGKVFLTANYSRGLTDIFEPTDYVGSGYNHEVIGITLGIYLGKPVQPEKKVADKDKDGIEDISDNCPDLPGPQLTGGCPDKDGDGIADKDDSCPDQPGSSANKGCPVPEVVEKPDTDKDGVTDTEDKCPTVAGQSRYEGCPIPDTDGDGINDEEDKCLTVKGTVENSGCPPQVIKEDIIEKVNIAARSIQFRYTQASLLPSSYPVLDEIVKILEQDPSLKLSIEGHTSSDGNPSANLKLSQERADNVKKYLETKGIQSSRLSARGFGQTQPLNNGKTEAEKALNRRVELKLSN